MIYILNKKEGKRMLIIDIVRMQNCNMKFADMWNKIWLKGNK